MSIHYPKSFFKLLSAGFLLAVLPLVIGLLIDTVAIGRLATQSQRAVYDAARVSHATRELSETASALERAAQQSVVLHDAALWDSYRVLHERFVAAGAQLHALPLETPMQEELDALLEREQQLNAALLEAGMQAPEAVELARRHAGIADSAHQLLGRSSGAIDREAESLRALAEQTEARVKAQLFMLLPFSIFVVAGFTYLLAKPIAQLEQGIRDLGERRFDTHIEVSGPDDLEQLGRQLDWLRLRLVQLEEQKSRFLRHISHELKTPLTALREGSDLLAEEVAGPLSAQQREIVRILRQNSLDLQRLIESLLRHGEAEFQQALLKLQSLKPAEIISGVVEKQKLAMVARDIRLQLQVDDFVMRTDGERFRIVFDNLLSNAIKFSPDGGTVTVIAGRQGDRALLEVIDEGPGVTADEREHLFDPFYQGQAVAGGVVKGSGLGLSIVLEHVLTLGGQIEAGLGRGHFTVKLPLNL